MLKWSRICIGQMTWISILEPNGYSNCVSWLSVYPADLCVMDIWAKPSTSMFLLLFKVRSAKWWGWFWEMSNASKYERKKKKKQMISSGFQGCIWVSVFHLFCSPHRLLPTCNQSPLKRTDSAFTSRCLYIEIPWFLNSETHQMYLCTYIRDICTACG